MAKIIGNWLGTTNNKLRILDFKVDKPKLKSFAKTPEEWRALTKDPSSVEHIRNKIAIRCEI